MRLIRIELYRFEPHDFSITKLTFEYDVPTYPGGAFPGRIVPATTTYYTKLPYDNRKWIVGRFYDFTDVTEE